MPVSLNVKWVEVLVDTGYGQTLVKSAKGLWMAEILHM